MLRLKISRESCTCARTTSIQESEEEKRKKAKRSIQVSDWLLTRIQLVALQAGDKKDLSFWEETLALNYNFSMKTLKMILLSIYRLV